jgi:hypothetical protein
MDTYSKLQNTNNPKIIRYSRIGKSIKHIFYVEYNKKGEVICVLGMQKYIIDNPLGEGRVKKGTYRKGNSSKGEFNEALHKATMFLLDKEQKRRSYAKIVKPNDELNKFEDFYETELVILDKDCMNSSQVRIIEFSEKRTFAKIANEKGGNWNVSTKRLSKIQ